MVDIDKLIKESLKSGNKTELKAYRNLKAEFQKVRTSKDYKGEWTEQIEMQAIAKYGRQLDAAIAEFGGSQTTLGAEYKDELEVVKKLLPKPVNEQDIYIELSDWCIKNNFCSEIEEFILMPQGAKTSGRRIELPKKEMGTAIKYLKSKFPTADGKMISEIVKKYLI